MSQNFDSSSRVRGTGGEGRKGGEGELGGGLYGRRRAEDRIGPGVERGDCEPQELLGDLLAVLAVEGEEVVEVQGDARLLDEGAVGAPGGQVGVAEGGVRGDL